MSTSELDVLPELQREELLLLPLKDKGMVAPSISVAIDSRRTLSRAARGGQPQRLPISPRPSIRPATFVATGKHSRPESDPAMTNDPSDNFVVVWGMGAKRRNVCEG